MMGIDDISKAEQGKKNFTEGYRFEDRVVDLYMLLNYKVEHGRIFSGRQVDMFMTNNFGDMTIYRAIECKAGNVTTDDIDKFKIKLDLVRLEYPAAYGTIVSGSSFTDSVMTQASHMGISVITARELAAQLIDGHSYAVNLIREIENNDRYRLSMYIVPNIGNTVVDNAIDAFSFFESWINDSSANQLTLLGDVGTGKSFFSRMIAYKLAQAFLESSIHNPLPILIDLRRADREFSLEGLIITHLRNSGLSKTSFDTFNYLLSQGYIVLILDGFDEMAAKISPQITNRNFQQLSRCVSGKSKVVLTCRTHYFKSRTEEEEVILGGSKDYGSESAKDLYWELISRKGFSIAYLRPFSISQVEEYVQRAKGPAAKEALLKIKQTYNLMELSSRPMLLEMIVKSIDSLNSSDINASKLYEVFTDAWIHRDKWRDVLSSDSKLKILMALAHSLWSTDSSFIYYKELAQYLNDELSEQIHDPHQLVEIDSEIRTASFLTRDENGYYGFAHKSYLEYFFAKYLSLCSVDNTGKWLHVRKLSPEVISFLHYLVDVKHVESYLEKLLLEPYKPQVSENALLCLYGFRRERVICERISADDHSDGSMSIQLPDKMQLRSAQLNQVNLEGAIMHEVDFQNASLCEAIMAQSNLSFAKMINISAEKANFKRADLSHSDLSNSNLRSVNFEYCNLDNSNLSSSVLSDSYCLHASLEDVLTSNCKFNGAVLPDNFSHQGKDNSSGEISKIRWDKIQKHLDYIRETVNRMIPYARRPLDKDDIVSDIIIALASYDFGDSLENLTKDEVQRITISRVRNIADINDREIVFNYTELSEYHPDFMDYVNNITGSDCNPVDIITALELADKLSDEAKLILTYNYGHGHSTKEISEKMNMSVYKVRRILTKTNEILREYVGDGFGLKGEAEGAALES